jgi:transcription elongation factor Elf1
MITINIKPRFIIKEKIEPKKPTVIKGFELYEQKVDEELLCPNCGSSVKGAAIEEIGDYKYVHCGDCQRYTEIGDLAVADEYEEDGLPLFCDNCYTSLEDVEIMEDYGYLYKKCPKCAMENYADPMIGCMEPSAS